MRIGICIPNYNRYAFVVEAIKNVINDERVAEIIICDDASENTCHEDLTEYYRNNHKVKLFRNTKNIGCFYNKQQAVSHSSLEWTILLDSDNVVGVDYIDELYKHKWDSSIIYTPSFAIPHFDFRAFEGLVITKQNIAGYIDRPMFETACNASNYFFNKSKWLNSCNLEVDPITSDSIFRIYEWIRRGYSLFVVPRLSYFHRVHTGSHYQNNITNTPAGLHQNILQKIRELN